MARLARASGAWQRSTLKAVAEYPTEKLERMWEYKEYVMEAVQATQPTPGGNDYPRHRADEEA